MWARTCRLDLFGGFALGVVAGAGANLLQGVPADRSPGTMLSAGSTDGTADRR
jgi:hypothetical protein